MQVKVNKKGYVTDYAEVGVLEGSISMKSPTDIDHFRSFFQAYFIRDGTLKLDKKSLSLLREQKKKEELRQLRAKACFPIINRGLLWYEGLSKKEKEELWEWYQSWLDVTATQKTPKRPDWLKD